MKAIIYARFSPRRNAEQCESIEMQLDLCREYCLKHGIEIVGEYNDRALSGSEEDRPGLWNAVEALKRDYVLVVYRLDRLARSVYLSYIIEQAVKKHGAKIVSICGEGTWQDQPEDELVRRILQALAEYERKVIAARTKAAMLRHQANGRRMSDRTPFGWLRDPDNHSRLIEDSQEQEIISTIVHLRETGNSYRQICRELEQQGLLCRGRQKWFHQTIKTILKRASNLV
jgi:site-specific DNA recombinase